MTLENKDFRFSGQIVQCPTADCTNHVDPEKWKTDKDFKTLPVFVVVADERMGLISLMCPICGQTIALKIPAE